jgi:hypothetical protein
MTFHVNRPNDDSRMYNSSQYSDMNNRPQTSSSSSRSLRRVSNFPSNPVEEYTSYTRQNNNSTTPSQYTYDTRGQNSNRHVVNSYNTDYINDNLNQETVVSEPRFFRVDSIKTNGRTQNVVTPVGPSLENINRLETPTKAATSSSNTPFMMTPPLSTSQLSDAYTNDTTHSTIGENRPESYIN